MKRDLSLTAPPLTAHELARMDFREGRKAMVRQEVQHMNVSRATMLMRELQREWHKEVGSILCGGLDLEAREFLWSARTPCGCCSSSGEVLGADGKLYGCPACEPEIEATFRTTYEGEFIESSWEGWE